ncbi:hydrolase [Oryctes borbonicus]|uniref:Carboxylic ester hydrolase n=1 Tax=Oryctes borbonicus TaxID=1629725 RepID=A0A0T6AZ67_9SCAR|nr:hydrolase [Oryctes borbonicus]
MACIKIFLLICSVLNIGAFAEVNDTQLPLVVTRYGSVLGSLMTSRNGSLFSAFRGIPFAKPPVGELRFKAPEEPEPWTYIFNATSDSNICIQQNYFFSKDPQIEGSEDCLYLNVYTPSITRNLLPVMVAFHYGGFMSGSSASDLLGPEYLMDKDVVLVTFNYRLGIFGFLSTYDDAAPGNWAFKDQVAALKWVRDNIEDFGGNPDCVTIFGASAGAASIHHQILSNQSKNLFHAAITQSGSALALWAQPIRELALQVARAQAIAVGCNDTVTTDMVDCLREIPAYDLVDSMNSFRYMRSEPLTLYIPTIEFETKSNPNPFITQDPMEIITNKEFSNVPWIIGITSGEGIVRAAPFVRQTDLLDIINENFEDYFPKMLSLELSVADGNISSTWASIKEFYLLDNDEINVTNPESIQGLINLYSDRGFFYPAYQTSLIHKHNGHENVWFYYFDYRGNPSYGELFAATDNQVPFQWGVSHCDDLLYLFKSEQIFPNTSLNGSDLEMSNLMLNFFTNFATYLDPTPQTLFDNQHRWEPLLSTVGHAVMQNNDLRYLKITGTYNASNIGSIQLNMSEVFHPDRMKFWIDLPLEENIQNLTSTL